MKAHGTEQLVEIFIQSVEIGNDGCVIKRSDFPIVMKIWEILHFRWVMINRFHFLNALCELGFRRGKRQTTRYTVAVVYVIPHCCSKNWPCSRKWNAAAQIRMNLYILILYIYILRFSETYNLHTMLVKHTYIYGDNNDTTVITTLEW